MGTPYIPKENLYKVSRDKDNSVFWSAQSMALDEDVGINMFGQVKSSLGLTYPGVYFVVKFMISGGCDERIELDGKEEVKCGICGEIGHNRSKCEINRECPNCGYEDPVVIIQSQEEPRDAHIYFNECTGFPIFSDEYSYRCIFCKS